MSLLLFESKLLLIFRKLQSRFLFKFTNFKFENNLSTFCSDTSNFKIDKIVYTFSFRFQNSNFRKNLLQFLFTFSNSVSEEKSLRFLKNLISETPINSTFQRHHFSKIARSWHLSLKFVKFFRITINFKKRFIFLLFFAKSHVLWYC